MYACIDFDLGVAFGPGYPLIRLQALATGRYPLLSLTQLSMAHFPDFNKDILSGSKNHHINQV